MILAERLLQVYVGKPRSEGLLLTGHDMSFKVEYDYMALITKADGYIRFLDYNAVNKLLNNPTGLVYEIKAGYQGYNGSIFTGIAKYKGVIVEDSVEKFDVKLTLQSGVSGSNSIPVSIKGIESIYEITKELCRAYGYKLKVFEADRSIMADSGVTFNMPFVMALDSICAGARCVAYIDGSDVYIKRNGAKDKTIAIRSSENGIISFKESSGSDLYKPREYTVVTWLRHEVRPGYYVQVDRRQKDGGTSSIVLQARKVKHQVETSGSFRTEITGYKVA